MRIARIRLSDKTSRLRPRHVVPKPAQTYEPEVPVEVREWIAPAPSSPDFVLEAQPPAQPHHLYVTCYTEGFSHLVTSMTAPVASGWSVRRVGLAPTGKRRLVTAHANSGHSDGTGRSNQRGSFPRPMDTAPRYDHHRIRRSKETTMDVGIWLRSLGLEQYET